MPAIIAKTKKNVIQPINHPPANAKALVNTQITAPPLVFLSYCIVPLFVYIITITQIEILSTTFLNDPDVYFCPF